MTQYPVPATNKILVGGVPLHMEFEAATASAILPGDLVQFNIPATDCNIKEGAADSEEIIGVADITPTPGATPPRGGNRVTAFAAGDQDSGSSWTINRDATSCIKRRDPVWRIRTASSFR